MFVAAVPELAEQRAALIADRFFGAPSQQLTIAGITGTNGKTTCAWLLAQALTHCRRPAAYIGTLGFGAPAAGDADAAHHLRCGHAAAPARARCATLGAECVCMEVSSHALDQARVNGVRFNTAVFTNLTRDHLDYHGTMEHYGAAKARLFAWPDLAHRVINVDDPFGAALAARPACAADCVTLRTAQAAAARRGALRARRARAARAGRPRHRGASRAGGRRSSRCA